MAAPTGEEPDGIQGRNQTTGHDKVLIQELLNHIRQFHNSLALIARLVLIGAALIAVGFNACLFLLTASAAEIAPLSVTDPAAEQSEFEHGTLLPIESLESPSPDKELRILALKESGSDQPAIDATEKQLLEEYARAQGLKPVWLLRDYPSELPEDLLAGTGDVIAGAEPAMLVRFPEEIEYTLPWRVTRQAVVKRNGDERIENFSDLARHSVIASRESPVWAKLLELAAKHPEMELIPAPQDESTASILQRVALGQYDLAVADSTFLQDYLPGKHDLRVAFELPGGERQAWAVRADDEALQNSMNRHLSHEALARGLTELRLKDLPQIREHGALRVITYRSPGNYYLDDNGDLRGFEYELVRKFAHKHGLRTEILVAPTQRDMLRWLLEGRGDLIAASVPVSGLRPDPRLSPSRPYNYAAPLLVGRDGERSLLDVRQLEGRRIVLPAGSPHLQVLERLRQRNPWIDIVEAGEHESTEQILSGVESGVYDLTVIDSHKADTLLALQEGLKIHFPISEPLPHVWVMRSSDQQLKLAVNEFIDNTYRSAEYNTLHARYFDRPQKFRPLMKMSQDRLMAGGILSPYDDQIRRSADEYGFDWRLIVAQMYQESRFDPAAISTAGAVGLMQILPTTASEIGLTELTDPKASITGGVRYLHGLYDRLENTLAYEDRIWFSLAAYNAGFGRLQQARRQAESMGLDPDRWFGHVEQAMLSLVHTTPCRCGQPVVYVREIRTQYYNYVHLTEANRYVAFQPGRMSRDS